VARKRNIMSIEGKTKDGVQAMGGVFKMMDTHGMPLMMVVDFLQSKGCIVAWDIFYEDAEKAGWKTETIELRMLEAIGDCYDHDYMIEFKEDLERWKKSRLNCTSQDISQSSESAPKLEPSKE
jgi:hypothetical protein